MSADISNTQFAMAGLLAAAPWGVRLDVDELSEIAAAIADLQRKDGWPATLALAFDPDPAGGGYATRSRPRPGPARARAFFYRGSDEASSARTTSALAALAMASRLLGTRRIDDSLRLRVTAGLRDGLAWLADDFSVIRNVHGVPELDGVGDKAPSPTVAAAARARRTEWLGYYMFGIEQLCGVCGVREISGMDWYREGATHLVRVQQEDGSWMLDEYGARMDADVRTAPALGAGVPDRRRLVDTAFGLLFLKRATRSVVGRREPVGEVTPGSGR